MSELVRIGATVRRDISDEVQRLADEAERSFAAEVRLALRHWIETKAKEQAVRFDTGTSGAAHDFLSRVANDVVEGER